jgi:hypothetical protein
MGCRREYYGLGGTKKWGSGEIYLMRSLLNDPYSSPTHIWVIKSRRKIWVGHAAQGRGVLHTFLWWGNLMETDHLEDPGIELHLHFINI